MQDGCLIWSAKLGAGSIYSSPCVASAVFAAALDGTCSSLAENDGHLLWKCKLNSPVFSSPAMIQDERAVLFAEVSGIVHCLSAEGGKEVRIFMSVSLNSCCEINRSKMMAVVPFSYILLEDSSVLVYLFFFQ